MKKLVEDAGIARQKFVHDPSKWDLENPMNIEFVGETIVCGSALVAEAPLEHNFRYPRIREHSVDNDGIALGGLSTLNNTYSPTPNI